LSGDDGCFVHDDDDGAAGVRVDVDQSIESNVESRFLSCFPDRSNLDFLAAIDVPAREHPQAITRFDGSTDEDDLVVSGRDNGADGNLRIEVMNVPAAPAHEPRRIAGFHLPCFEGAATCGTEAKHGFLRHRSPAELC